tara:strand:+ start:194 stop:1204 length:1011 start_codon:yes stop_codon:yes gene_type:complete
MSGSIKESFERAFKDKNTANKKAEKYESDDDSGKEQEKQVEMKRAKKRKRTTRKPNKAKKSVSQFKVRTAPTKERVTSDKYPEILSVDKEFSSNHQQTELIIAQTRFFKKENQDAWSRTGEYQHMRPVDYLFVRALIQRPPIPHFDIHQMNDRERLRSNVEPVTRAYEENFLCEPVGSQRACLMGNECEGLFIHNAKDRAFILREFLKPSEHTIYQNTGKYPSEPRLCLMCKRKELARAHTNVRADGMGIREDTILSDTRNLVDVPGEYCLKDCIVSSRNVYEGILDPVVLHVRSAYRLQEKNGIRHYEQWRMGYPSKKKEHLFNSPPRSPPHPSK